MFPLSPSHSLSPTASTGSSRRMLFNSPMGSSRRGLIFSSSDSVSSAAPAVTPEEKEKIFKWVMGDECKTRDDLNKYKEPDFTVASRMFDICKSTELDCLFADMRKTLNPRQLCILAFAHSETTFASPEIALSYLKASKTKMVQGPSQGSLGHMKIALNNDTLYRFVMSDKCKTVVDIDEQYTLRDEIERAKLMFEVIKDVSVDNMFVAARSQWTEKELSLVAKEHSYSPFKTIESANNYLALAEKHGVSTRSFSNYLPMPALEPEVKVAAVVTPLYLP